MNVFDFYNFIMAWRFRSDGFMFVYLYKLSCCMLLFSCFSACFFGSLMLSCLLL
jgi:hypothetical protein